MTESDNPQGEIPSHWNFERRAHPNLRIKQIDERTGFLAYESLGESALLFGEEFYDEHGKKRSYFDSVSQLRSLSHMDVYHVEGEIFNADYGISSDRDGILLRARFQVLGDRLQWGWLRPNHLAHARYHDRQRQDAWGSLPLESLQLGMYFNPMDSEAKAPIATLERSPARIYGPEEAAGWSMGISGESLSTWNVNMDLSQGGIASTVFINKETGNIEYTSSWEVVDDIVHTETLHTPTGLIKVVDAPLFVFNKNMQGLVGHAPYEKNEEGLYDIPWTKMGEAIGVRVGYKTVNPEDL